MKKRNLLALLTLFGVTTVAAHTQNDTTIVVDHPTRVRIVETADQMKVSVEGTSGNSQFKLERTREIGKDGLSVNRERKEWDFNVPFLNKDREKRVGNISCHWPGFFIGFSTLTQKPAGIQSTFGSSVEIGFSPIQVQSPMLARNLRASWCLGFSWRNYRLTGHQRWVKNGSSLELAPYPEGSDIQFSRIKTFSLVVPMLLEWQKSLGRHSNIWITGGGLVNFTTYASVKTRYKLDGEKHKEFDKSIHQEPLTLDLYGAVGINNLGLYVRYSPFNLLKTEYAPELKGLTVGLLIDLGFDL